MILPGISEVLNFYLAMARLAWTINIRRLFSARSKGGISLMMGIVVAVVMALLLIGTAFFIYKYLLPMMAAKQFLHE
jgi:hypothetical protein